MKVKSEGIKKDKYYRLWYGEWMWANEGVSVGIGWFNDTRHNREKKNQLQLPYMGMKITIKKDRFWSTLIVSRESEILKVTPSLDSKEVKKTQEMCVLMRLHGRSEKNM